MSSPTARDRLWIPLALVLAVALVYAPVRAHGFVSFDDEVYLSANPRVAKGLDWAEIRWFFTHDHAGNYHPLTWVSHMLDVELFGLAPGPHHLVSVALHALNAVLVFFLGRRLLAGSWAAAGAAALFALHPLRVESVAWASERKDVLCATFLLSACLAWLAYGRRPSPLRFLGVTALFLLALLAKPMAVTFPCLALLLDLWPLGRLEARRPWLPAAGPDGRRGARVYLEKLPLLALAALGAWSTWIAQERGGAAGPVSLPLELRLENALASLAVYVRETLWPRGLAVFHPLATLTRADPRAALLPGALAGLALLVGAAWLGWRARTRRPWITLGVAWSLGMLVPVIGLKQVGAQAHADRYTYLPLLGLAWILAGAVAALAVRGPRARRLAAAASLVALAGLGAATRAQLATWRDSRALFEHALAVTERNYLALASLGTLALEEGRPEEARELYARALAIHPNDAQTLNGLARLELGAGDVAAAEEHLRRAAALGPSPFAHLQLGRAALLRDDLPAAARQFARALELDPGMVDAHYNLGQVRFRQGRPAEARASFAAALALAPRHAGALNGMGVLALDGGDPVEAEQRFREACASDPDWPDALHNLALALERLGRRAEARDAAARARTLEQTRSP